MATVTSPAATEDAIEFIPLAALTSGKYQPRGSIDPTGIQALASSIAKSGLMQPLVIRPLPGRTDRYEVIAGERRWKALQHLGRSHAPAIIRAVGDQQAAELALVENLQREDLNPMDRAAALRRLVDEFGLTHQQLAEQVGMDRATITNVLRLNELDSQTAALVRSGALSAGHAKVLVGLADAPRRIELAEAAVTQEWSVRQLESAVKAGTPVPRGTPAKPSARSGTGAHVAQLERQLEAYLGTRVAVRLGRKKGAGELRVKFFSLDEFDGLMQRIGFRDDNSRIVV
jgi:ParB family chromosome partitioning protein